MTQNEPGHPESIEIEVWADLACPWCYVGKHRLQRAIQNRPDAERFNVRLRSFELNPDAPHTPETIEQAFVRSHGGDADVVLQAERQIQGVAHRDGLPFDLDRLNANTFDFHRVLHYAATLGLADTFFSTVQDQFFAGTLNPFDSDALVTTGASIGLDEARIRSILMSDEYADNVRADINEGRSIGVNGVPFTVFGRRFAVSGAQSVTGYGQALEQVLKDQPV